MPYYDFECKTCTITIETTEPEYVAAIKFGGFANTASINKQKEILKKIVINLS